MSGDLTIQQARLVLPDRCVVGDLLIRDGTIAAIAPKIDSPEGEVIDGTGLVCMPGAIDAHVQFRDPGQTHKEDMRTGSRAAASGGVTAFLDMPNTHPATSSIAVLDDKFARAAEVSSIHYGFFIGANESNLAEVISADRACGIKISLTSKNGNLAIRNPEALEQVFATCNKLVAIHAEDPVRLEERGLLYSDSHDVADHPRIRDVETALNATSQAIKLAQKHGTRLHVLHVTSEEEADLLAQTGNDRISAEACIQHLLMDAETAYAQLGTFAQCNPPIRAARHRDALWRHLVAGTFGLVTSDHTPHTRDEKERRYPESPSGMPGVEWTLPLLLDRVNAGACSLSDVARWVCEGPAQTYRIPRKGRLEVGFDGDVVLVDMAEQRVITHEMARTKVGWSPYAGRSVQGWPVVTVVMGVPVYRDGQIIDSTRGRQLTFGRNELGHHRTDQGSVRSWQSG